jgi:hypothetical protein
VASAVAASFRDVGSAAAEFVANSATTVPADRTAANLLADQVKARFLATRLSAG